MILVDTSVWSDHLRKGNPQLARLLQEGRVCTHPFVIGELACGALRNREEVLGLLKELPRGVEATHEEVMDWVRSRRLHGRRIGWVDAHLLASALLSGCALWTLDRRLAQASAEVGVAE